MIYIRIESKRGWATGIGHWPTLRAWIDGWRQGIDALYLIISRKDRPWTWINLYTAPRRKTT